jgi:Metalloenzyme superfamily
VCAQIPSDKIVFNEKPEMKAREICDGAKEAILSGKFDMIRVNFANPDMVGHTGDLKASIVVRCSALPLHHVADIYGMRACNNARNRASWYMEAMASTQGCMTVCFSYSQVSLCSCASMA